MVMVMTRECCGVQPTVSGQRCRVVLSDLCKVSVAAKSEAAEPNCWRWQWALSEVVEEVDQCYRYN